MNQPRSVPDLAKQIQMLADSAQALAQRGNFVEAEQVYRQILKAAPYHADAWNFLAVQAMKRNELEDSQRYLEEAIRSSPNESLLHQNMGVVLRRRGELESALASFERVTVLEPEHQFAFLHKGSVLEALGRADEAVVAYRQGFRNFPEAVAVANNPHAPAMVRDLVRQAAAATQMAQLRSIHGFLAPVLERHGKEALDRVIQAADIYVGHRRPDYRHALQRPSYIYLPGLEPQPFFDRQQFASTAALESAAAGIREELQAALAAGQGFAPYVQTDKGQDPQQWRKLDGSRDWSALHLYKAGTRVDENCARCPKTTGIVESLQPPMIPGHAPEALFSVLQPGTHIPPHFGLANYKLVTHLPLIVPPDCGIRVGNETRAWTEGECLVFDDSFQHEAWNRSSAPRAVLILDVWHPEVTLAEQEGINALVQGISAFRKQNA